jgi:putative membrane-bound dehydrogenase-like protein
MALPRRFLLLLAAALLALPRDSQPSTQAADWRPVQVPGPRKASEAPGADGVAWYRAWVKVDDSFFSKHERNLFEESVGVNLRDLAGAHEVWVNGKKIGAGDRGLQRHKVPVGTLRKGEWNEIAIRVQTLPGAAPGGFLGDAPFIMNYFMECVFEGAWEYRPGGDYTPGVALAKKPASAAFDVFRESNRVLGRAEQVHGASLPPAESASKLEPGREFSVELLLHEPLVAQPFHFSFDERGRLWVAQSRQYPYPAGLTMISRDKYYRAHYDKVPPAPPNHDRGMDIISIHESTKGDGVYDRHKVFVDGLNMANAVVRGHGGVWVMHTPYLLFYPDADGDDVPDGPPEVRLAGFGLEDTHSTANGLVWGPDGWLYGGQGSTTSCRVTRPGLDPPGTPGVAFEGCMVWRYHPRTKAFEIFAEGSGNTFGLEVDAQGRLYSGHNGGGTRGWHYVQGGFYQMQGVDPGKFGPPRNPYAFGELPKMNTADKVVRFTHFGAFAEGTAMPSKYAGMLFGLDPLHNLITTSVRTPRGSTFDTTDQEPALRSSDVAFRPVYIANAPDGSLHFSDMYEFYIAHGQHYQNQIDPTTGRIYRLRGKDSVLETDINLSAKSTKELVAFLGHPNKWHRHTAVRLLGERKDPAAAPLLQKAITTDTGLGALNALWALHQVAGLNSETALAALAHPYAPVRLWAARLLGDEWGLNRNLGVGRHNKGPGLLPDSLFEALLARARIEPDAEVLSQFAATARRLNGPQALPLAAAVLGHDEAVQDPYIPLLCWWVFEAHIPASNGEIAALFKSPALWDKPMVFDQLLARLARRYAVEGKRQDLLLCAQLFQDAPSPRHAAQLLKGLEEAFRGRPMTGLPDELLAGLKKAGQLPLIFRLRLGEPDAAAEAVRKIQDAGAKAEERLLFARAFGELRDPRAVPALLAAASGPAPDELRKASLSSLSSYDDEAIGTQVAALLPKLGDDLRSAGFALLASRAKWSVRLLDSVQAGRVKAKDVPDDVATRLRASEDKAVADLAAQVLPVSVPVAAEFQKRIDQITAVLKGGAGNPYAGEATFTDRCSKCHKLFFKGGNVGPDLTQYQRDNLGTMLLSIVNPSAEIREGYQYYLVATTDDRILSGFFVDRDNQVTVLRSLEGENITLRASQIRAIKPTGQSLMPVGLLDGLSDVQLRDFFAYLRISQPISK